MCDYMCLINQVQKGLYETFLINSQRSGILQDWMDIKKNSYLAGLRQVSCLKFVFFSYKISGKLVL